MLLKDKMQTEPGLLYNMLVLLLFVEYLDGIEATVRELQLKKFRERIVYLM